MNQYREEDKVLVKAHNLSDKYSKQTPKFMAVFEGPYLIAKVIRNGTYVIKDPSNGKDRGMFHTNDIRAYHV